MRSVLLPLTLSLAVSGCALFKSQGPPPNPRSVAFVVDEKTTGAPRPGAPGVTVASTSTAGPFGKYLTGKSLAVSPVNPQEPGSVDSLIAKKLGQDLNLAYVLFGRVALANHEGMMGGEGQQLTFPVTGMYTFSLLRADTGASLGVFDGKLAAGKAGENPGSAMRKTVISYERTARDLAEAGSADVLDPVVAAIEADLAARQASLAPPTSR